MTFKISTRIRAALTCTFAIAVLAACSQKKDEIITYVPCPRVSILADASELTQFKSGAGRDVTDVEYHGKITEVDFSCAIDRKKDQIIAKADIWIEVEMGPAAPLSNPDFQVFLALTEAGEQIIDKSLFSLRVNFKDNARRAVARQKIKNIKFPMNGPVPVEGHDVFIGFQLTPAQVSYNRTKTVR